MKRRFDLVVLDMAGTTVRDRGEVRTCILAAARETGLETTREQVLGMMGWSKRKVFETLWREQIGEQPALASRIDHSYTVFCKILERHFETERVEPTAGCLATLAWLHRWGVPVCLTTGFYRRVTNIILRRLDWTVGSKGTVQYSVTSDEVPQGRPAPDMILRCMELAGVRDPRRVVNVGDTPSDLASGRNAGCGWSLAVTNGTYTKEQLSAYPNDGLLASLADLKRRLTS